MMNGHAFSTCKATILVAALALCGVGLAVEVDSQLPEYQVVSGVSGNLNSIGSDTLNNLMTFWAEKFRASYPSVKIQVEGKGSATAPPALTESTAQLGPMSRSMKATEVDGFEKKHGHKPTQIKVAVDALAVFVHRDNPLKGLSLQQVDAIFSKTLKAGGKEIAKWGDLGLEGDWANRPISLYGRNSASGTYGYFKEHALAKGDFKDTVKEQAGSASVVESISVDKYAIGYSGIGYATAGVRAVPLANRGTEYVEATSDNAYAGKYPLARYLYVYLNKVPAKPVDPLVREFVKLILSKEGQLVVIKDGYYPLPASITAKELKKLEESN